jgi:two-component system, chemotaxis family, sensor kinase CheA
VAYKAIIMTIKNISKIISLTFAINILLFIGSVSWSLKHLNTSFSTVEFFGQQKDKIFTQVSQPILGYLLTGDAIILGKVTQALIQIKTDVESRENLSNSLKEPFVTLIDGLEKKTLIELTAAGKLADPQTLLINNEKQLSMHLQKLLSYVKEAQSADQPKRQRYLNVVGESQAALIALARARQSFFSSRSEMSTDNITKPLEEFIKEADELKKLPLLGIMKQAKTSDVMSFGEQSEKAVREDKAIEPISEIPSLLQHYKQDLANAIRVSQDKINGRTNVNQQISSLQQSLLTLETELTKEYQHYEYLTFIITGISMLLITLQVLGCIGGSRKFLRRISNLEGTMSDISHTSDLSLRADASIMDEIGNMAQSFNIMVEKLGVTSEQVKHKINDIQTMLKNMPQGLLSFDGENKIRPEYSAYLERILETNDIAGHDFIKLIFENSNLGVDTIAKISATAEACIGEDSMNFEFNNHLLVHEIEKIMPSGLTKTLELRWAPVINEDEIVDQILLCIRDVTELRKLSAQSAEQKLELEIIGEILGVSEHKFDQFMATSIAYKLEIEGIIQDNPNGGVDAINAIFRNMHTIKGNARTHGLTTLSDKVHYTESVYDELRKPNTLLAWNQASLLEELAEVRQLIERYAKTNEISLGRKKQGHHNAIKNLLMVDYQQILDAIHLLENTNNTDIDQIIKAKNIVHKTLKKLGTEPLSKAFAAIVDSLPVLAKSLGKANPEVIIHDSHLQLKVAHVSVINDIFTHLFRNSLGHGIEVPDVRLLNNKPAQGRIEVSLVHENDYLKITITDDGCGLSLNKIREKAINNGLISAEEILNDEQTAALILEPGFTTADILTNISGRGVGMDAVLGFVRKEDGFVKINFTDNKEGSVQRSIEITVYLPAHYAVDVDGVYLVAA